MRWDNWQWAGIGWRLPPTPNTPFPRRSEANSGVDQRLVAWLDSPPVGPGMNPGEEPCVLIGAVGAPTAPGSREPDILRATRPTQSRNGLSAVPFHICPNSPENTLPVCHPVTGGRLPCLHRPGHHDRAHGRDYHPAIAKPSLRQGRAGRRATRLARRGRVCGDRSTMSKSETAAIITAQPRGRTRYPAGGGQACRRTSRQCCV